METQEQVDQSTYFKGDQADAFEHITHWLKEPGGGMFLLEGYAGTGKTFLAKALAQYIEKTTVKSLLITALTNKALKVIRNFVGQVSADFRTYHSALALREMIDQDGKIYFDNDPRATPVLDQYHIMFVDESSMLDDHLFHKLLPFQDKLKILFIGDPVQIPPVNNKDCLIFSSEERVAAGIKHFRMTSIIRQTEGNPIIDLATRVRQNINRPVPVPIIQSVKNTIGIVEVVQHKTSKKWLEDMINFYFKSQAYLDDTNHFKIVAWTNRTVNKYNKQIREQIYGEAAKARLVEAERIITDEALIEDGQVFCMANEELIVQKLTVEILSLGEGYDFKYYRTECLVDGTGTNIVIKVLHEDSVADFEGLLKLAAEYAKSMPKGTYKAAQAWRDFYDTKRTFHAIKYSYCITAHKSQGSTYNNAILMLYDMENNQNVVEKNRIFYTAITRPRFNLYIVE
jgi:exodeoxyribonuclease V